MSRYAAFLLLAAAPATAEPLAITGATAWTMTAPAPVVDATIVIDGGRIISVTAGGAVPPGVRVVSAAGRIVTPGLIDAATQIGLGEVGAIAEEGGATVGKGPLGAAFDVRYALDPNDQTIRQARADGLAQAMVYPGGSGSAPFDGTALLLKLGADEASAAPRPAAMVASVGGGIAAAIGGSRGAAWQLLRNALDEARVYRRGRHGGVPRDQLLNHLDAEALAPVVAGTLPLMIRTDRLSDIRQAIALAADYRLRLILLGGAEAWAAADTLAAAGITVILDPMDELPDSYDTIGARRDNAALLAKAGVTIAISVSAQEIHRSWNAAPSMREGAGVAVAAGLPYASALAAITSAPARIIGLDAKAGTLVPGAAADLVIWDGDPLEPTSAPAAVFSDGRAVSLVTRQTMLRERYAPVRR